MEVRIHQTTLALVRGDITDLAVEAIVNPANAQLILGGGVAGAIRQKGGPAIQAACNALAPIEVGQAVLTPGGDLKARFVIHAVGPRQGEGDEDEKLRRATAAVLALADRHQLASLAFCAISTGIFGYPKDRCAAVMLAETLQTLAQPTALKTVLFCLYDAATYDIFERTLKRLH